MYNLIFFVKSLLNSHKTYYLHSFECIVNLFTILFLYNPLCIVPFSIYPFFIFLIFTLFMLLIDIISP
jgi:hypothetical protein